MAIEAGGKNGVIPADDITTTYVDARNAGNRPYEIFNADPNVSVVLLIYHYLSILWLQYHTNVLAGVQHVKKAVPVAFFVVIDTSSDYLDIMSSSHIES